jgi:alpha-D-xyloside xylohydrolase
MGEHHTGMHRKDGCVRAGAILPMGPEIQYMDEKPADPIELRICPGADGSFELYEDEGTHNDYLKGEHAIIPISWNDKERVIAFGKRQGAYPGMLEKRTFRVVLMSPGQGVGGGFAETTAIMS